MATLAIKGNKARAGHILALFNSLGATGFITDSIENDRLYYIGHKGKVLSIADQPDNIYRNLLFNVYTIESFESRFPLRPGDKVAFDVYESPECPVKEKVSVVNSLSWNTECCDICYTMADGYKRSISALRKVMPFNPKDGDVVSSGAYIFVCKKHLSNDEILAYFGYDFYSDKIIVDSARTFYADHIATEEEKKKLFDKLKEEGYEWDAEEKELVKLKWKPVLGEVYFRVEFVDHEFRYADWNWKNSTYEIEAYERGWCFKTKEECQVFCDKLNQAIKNVEP
jgi:hypothetical protein